jgi:hypothetical protein
MEPSTTTPAPTEKSSQRLNAAVAITVALLATFMAICKVKDDNIVQAMQQAQADKLDHWGYYQARNIRQEIADATVVQLELARSAQAVAATPANLAALQDQKTYDALNFKDDQFDLSDALLAIAVALLAVTALTQLWPLFWVALVPTAFGVLMGLAGLTGLPIHPEALVRLLS